MAKITFISDTHLGLKRQDHTTVESSRTLAERLFYTAHEVCRARPNVYHLGDLFDNASNSECDILKGEVIASLCKGVLCGNHDSFNRANDVPSLALLKAWHGGKIISQACRIPLPDKCALYFVPHQMAQKDFEEELEKIVEATMPGEFRVLCLHCNYDSPFAKKYEASLNLTREQAERLLDWFDLILLGHEHVARSDFGGRLQVLGSLHPTSFSDISDKWFWEFDTESKALSKTLVWPEHERCRVIHHTELPYLLDNPDHLDAFEFMTVNGVSSPSRMVEVAKLIQQVWQAGENLLMVRNSVVVEGMEVEAVDGFEALNVVEKIRQELGVSIMRDRFERFLGEVRG